MNQTNHHIDRCLPAEWAPQSTVVFAWPHEESDWAPLLEEAEQCFTEIVSTASRFQSVSLLCHSDQVAARVNQHLSALPPQQRQQITLITTPYNDTWVRDYGPITIQNPHAEGDTRQLLDFTFNGWGNKYSSDLDNRVSQQLYSAGIWKSILGSSPPIKAIDLVLEGGSIESDGLGTLLTTQHCLTAPNRNQPLHYETICQRLKADLGATRILSLTRGYLEGDDTDGHIDTLARFCDANTIIYQGCQRQEDSHYSELQAMAEELAAFRQVDGSPYQLHSLPLPNPQLNQQGERLPATYANFLILNDAVLVPTYHDPADRAAVATIDALFPERSVIGINCNALIQQGGSLHCCSMQIPQWMPPSSLI